MSAPSRHRIGRFRLLNTAADALRHVRTDGDQPVLDCPYCAATLHSRRTAAATDTHCEGGPLHTVLLDHLFHDCPTTEATP